MHIPVVVSCQWYTSQNDQSLVDSSLQLTYRVSYCVTRCVKRLHALNITL